MKKKYLFQVALFAAALLPANSWAQTSRLNFESDEATDPKTEISLDDGNGFKVVAKSDKGKIDGNNLYFAYSSTDENYESNLTKRWNVGAPLTPTNENRNMTITVPSAGKLNLYVRCGNKTAADRTLTLKQGDSELFNNVIQDADAFDIVSGTTCYPIVSVDVAKGDITVTTSNTINFYGFAFTPTAASSVDVTIGDAKYATFANNTVGTLGLPEGVKAYGVSAINDGKVTFTEYNVIPAGVGVILSGNADTYTLNPTDVECTYSGENYMVAVTADQTVAEKAGGKLNYIFANKTNGVGFYKSSGEGTISKGKAYLSITDESVDNRTWDFTAKKIWSDATIANLEVERQKTEGKVWDTNAGSETDGWRYRYTVATNTEEMYANGTKIAELEGLFFRGDANRLGIDNRSTNRFYLAGNKFFIVIPDLKAGSTVTISTKTSSNGNAAYVTCADENAVTTSAQDQDEVDNIFTINAFGSYEFQPNRALYITKITVNYGGSSAAARAFIGLFDNTTTGISTTESKSVTDGQWYTLGGMRIDKPTTKGIYVRNGKKFIVK